MKHRNSWNEFNWEQEIQRYEEQITCFFQGLVYCIDLPAEEACANFSFGTETPSTLVATGSNPALQDWIREHDSEDEEDHNRFMHRRQICLMPVDTIDQMCAEWNEIFASQLPQELITFGMGITCAYAKFLARCADFTEPSKECSNAMLISLGKHSLQDLLDLIFMLDEISNALPETAAKIKRQKDNLFTVREQIIARLNELRSAN